MKKIDVVLIGAGNRGTTYTDRMAELPDKFMGTKGEVSAAIEGNTPVEVYEFETGETTVIPMEGKDGIAGGHGGGDEGLANALYDYLCGTYTGKSIPEIRESCENHLIAFAAEKSRKENCVVDFKEYTESL